MPTSTPKTLTIGESVLFCINPHAHRPARVLACSPTYGTAVVIVDLIGISDSDTREAAQKELDNFIALHGVYEIARVEPIYVSVERSRLERVLEAIPTTEECKMLRMVRTDAALKPLDRNAFPGELIRITD